MAVKAASKKKTAPVSSKSDFSIEGLPEDITLMDDLIRKYYQELLKGVKENVKMGDFIKMIEFRRKLAPAESAQKKFWAMLDKVRKEALGGESKLKPDTAASSKN